jgi:hypothetical protein
MQETTGGLPRRVHLAPGIVPRAILRAAVESLVVIHDDVGKGVVAQAPALFQSVGHRAREDARQKWHHNFSGSAGNWAQRAFSAACCAVVSWTTFLGLQFQMDRVGLVIALS